MAYPVLPATGNATATVPPMPNQPPVAPSKQDRDRVKPANSYRATGRVWVHRGGQWRPGVALLDGSHALLVRYRYGGNEATAVDTVAAASIRERIEADPVLDQPVAYRGQMSAHDPTLLPASGTARDLWLKDANGRQFGWHVTPAPAQVQITESITASRDQVPDLVPRTSGRAVRGPR